MKKTCRFLVLSWLACGLLACSPLDIDFNDPQEINFIQDEFDFLNNPANEDLLDCFGRENIHFGPVPPTWSDSICFMVDSLVWDTCIRFIYGPNDVIQPSHADPPESGDFDGSITVHLFHDLRQVVFKHEMKTRDTWANYYVLDLEKAYIIGHDSLFTTYFQGKTIGNGNPTIIMLISGSMAFDKTTGEFIGVKDYVIGKKIIEYEEKPSPGFAPGTIEVKRRPGLSPKCDWNDL